MDNPRPEKVGVVEEVKGKLADSDAAILTEYRGLTVKQIADLRTGLRETGGEYKVYKNTLVRFAVRDLELTDLEGSLTGPTAIAFVKGDPVAVAKILKDFSKTNPALVVKGGVLGTKTLSASDASALADLPSRDVVLSQLAGLFAQPMQQFAGLLQALPRNMAYGLAALRDKKVEAGEGPAPTEEAAPAAESSPSAESQEENAPAAEAAGADAEATTDETKSE